MNASAIVNLPSVRPRSTKGTPTEPDHVTGTWRPSPERMAAYLEREVVLATVNIKRLLARGCKRVLPDDLLCTTATLSRALQALRQDGYDV